MVEEDLGFAPAGHGQHLLVRVHKRDANTEWVARATARARRLPLTDVGYAGLKDRRAVAVQWFSLPRGRRAAGAGRSARDGFGRWRCSRTTASCRAARSPATTSPSVCAPCRAAALTWRPPWRAPALISRDGVPNYFGPQRFGRDGANLARMAVPMRSLRPAERGFVLSAARSVIFNALLAERVVDGSWGQVLGRGPRHARRSRQLLRRGQRRCAARRARPRAQHSPERSVVGAGAAGHHRCGTRARGARRGGLSAARRRCASARAWNRSAAACAWRCASCAGSRRRRPWCSSFASRAAAMRRRCCAS